MDQDRLWKWDEVGFSLLVVHMLDLFVWLAYADTDF